MLSHILKHFRVGILLIEQFSGEFLKLKSIYPFSFFFYDKEDIIWRVSLNRVRIDNVWIGIPPYLRIFSIADFFSLTQFDLMWNGIFFISLVIILEGVITLFKLKLIRNRNIESCLLCVDVSISEGFKAFGMVRCKDGYSFNDELIRQMVSIVTNQGPLSHLQVAIIESWSHPVKFLFNCMEDELLLT